MRFLLSTQHAYTTPSTVVFVSCITGGAEFWLFTLFDKDEVADLGPQDRKALEGMVKAELETRRNV